MVARYHRFFIFKTMKSKLEKDYDEFIHAIKTCMSERDLFMKTYTDYDEHLNMELVIASVKVNCFVDCTYHVNVLYSFEYPTIDIPVQFSSCNEQIQIQKEYIDEFLHPDNENRILADWRKIYSQWLEIKKSENRDMAIKKLLIYKRTDEMKKDFE